MTDTNPWRSTGAQRTNWRDHAACSRLDPDLFFPVSTSGASLTDSRRPGAYASAAR